MGPSTVGKRRKARKVTETTQNTTAAPETTAPAETTTTAPPAPKPAPRTRKAPAKSTTAKPAPAKPTARRTATAKPASPKAPAVKAPAKATTAKANGSANGKAPAKANGSGNGTTLRTQKQDARSRVVETLVKEFAKATPDEKAMVSYWLHSLPTGGADGSGAGGANRWWPAGLPRPTTADWTAK